MPFLSFEKPGRGETVNSIERYRATYNFEPVDHLYRKDFYIWEEALERWKSEGMPADADLARLFGYDEPAFRHVDLLGWCEPAFVPAIEETVLESGDDYDIVRDNTGRTVKFFKGRRHGFMPTYLKHPVASRKDWEEEVAPLLSPETPQRLRQIESALTDLKEAYRGGTWIIQNIIGGYMYLRALVGPVEICYMFIDDPALVHRMMQRWLDLADAVCARLQEHVEFDELYLGEDICYNHGLLISPDMVREFIFPYYRQLRANIEARQKRRLFIHIDTDGNVDEALGLYRDEVNIDAMSPFEIAAGNDVLEIARRYPDLVMSGGIDKRVLAKGPEAIDEYLERVIPPMVERGGYIPTCDHGIPDNVSFENYMHYRKRIMELDH